MLLKKEEANCVLALLEKKAVLKTESFLWQIFHIHVDVTGREKSADGKDNETNDKNKDNQWRIENRPNYRWPMVWGDGRIININ
eukprot:8179963-Ditylum_brightwellii.AAC.1